MVDFADHSPLSIAASRIAFISSSVINLRDDRTIHMPNTLKRAPQAIAVDHPITLFEPWYAQYLIQKSQIKKPMLKVCLNVNIGNQIKKNNPV